MFDIAPSELLLVVIVAVVAIGPKDMPRALRTAGRWIGKFRRMSNHFRSGFEAMIREAELEEMERTWREQNEAIMRAHPQPALPSEVVIDAAPIAAEPGPVALQPPSLAPDALAPEEALSDGAARREPQPSPPA